MIVSTEIGFEVKLGGSDLTVEIPTGTEMKVGRAGWLVKIIDDAILLIRVGFKLLMTTGSDMNVGTGLLLMTTGWEMMVDGPGLRLEPKKGSDVTAAGLLLMIIGSEIMLDGPGLMLVMKIGLDVIP